MTKMRQTAEAQIPTPVVPQQRSQGPMWFSATRPITMAMVQRLHTWRLSPQRRPPQTPLNQKPGQTSPIFRWISSRSGLACRDTSLPLKCGVWQKWLGLPTNRWVADRFYMDSRDLKFKIQNINIEMCVFFVFFFKGEDMVSEQKDEAKEGTEEHWHRLDTWTRRPPQPSIARPSSSFQQLCTFVFRGYSKHCFWLVLSTFPVKLWQRVSGLDIEKVVFKWRLFHSPVYNLKGKAKHFLGHGISRLLPIVLMLNPSLCLCSIGEKLNPNSRSITPSTWWRQLWRTQLPRTWPSTWLQWLQILDLPVTSRPGPRFPHRRPASGPCTQESAIMITTQVRSTWPVGPLERSQGKMGKMKANAWITGALQTQHVYMFVSRFFYFYFSHVALYSILKF